MLIKQGIAVYFPVKTRSIFSLRIRSLLSFGFVTVCSHSFSIKLIAHAVHIAQNQERPSRQDFCDKNDFGGAVHRCIHYRFFSRIGGYTILMRAFGLSFKTKFLDTISSLLYGDIE